MGSLLDNSLQIISKSSRNSLFLRLWPVKDTPKGIVYIVHDLGGHCLLYDAVAARFIKEGYTVASHDHHGHGLSSGTRYHTSSYQVYIDDVLQCLEEVRFQYPDTSNVILFGHGVGGLLAALIAARQPEMIKRLILQNPILKFKEEDKRTANMCWYASYVLPYMYSPFGGVDPALLITDQRERQKYANDPFVWQEGSRLSVLHAIQSAMSDLHALSCPSLIQIGTQSPLINEKDLAEWGKECAGRVKVLSYENAKHYLQMESKDCLEQVLQDMIEYCGEDDVAT